MKNEEIYTIFALIISIIAIFQTRKQIKINKKESLFNKRMETFFICQKLLNFYEQNEYLLKKIILNAEDIEKIFEFIIIHFDWKEENKIDEVMKTIETLPFLFSKNDITYIQNFCYLLLFLIKHIFYTYAFLEKIDKLKEIEEEELLNLKRYFITNTFLPSWTKGQEDLIHAYEYIKKKKLIKKIKKQISFF